MVEMSLSLIVFLGVVGFIFDLGIAMYRYMILSHVTQTVTRDTATFISSLPDNGANAFACSAASVSSGNDPKVIDYSYQQAHSYISGSFGMSTADGTFQFDIDHARGKRFLVITGNMSIPCFFCNLISRNGLTITIRDQALIDVPHNRFSCI